MVPASQVLRVALPRYVLDDPALARAWDEASADRLAERLAGLRIVDLLRALETGTDPLSAVGDGDATPGEVAAVMAAGHLPLVVVVDGGVLLGAVTAGSLIAHLSR